MQRPANCARPPTDMLGVVLLCVRASTCHVAACLWCAGAFVLPVVCNQPATRMHGIYLPGMPLPRLQESFTPADLADLAAQGEQAPLLMSGLYLRFDAGAAGC